MTSQGDQGDSRVVWKVGIWVQGVEEGGGGNKIQRQILQYIFLVSYH